jgi:hypothetical protein
MLMSAEGGDLMARFDDMRNIRSAVSDQAGEFVVIGIPKTATNAMADHPALGRSLAIAVPEGADDPPPLNLALRSFGSISGKVISQGKPVPRATITDASKGGGLAASIAQTDDEGNFMFSRAPEGVHVLQVMQQQMMSMKTTSANVTVVAGKEAKVVIDVPVGALSLTVAIKPLPNNQVDAAQVFLVSGAFTADNGKQLNEGLFQGGAKGMKFWLGGGAMPKFDELVAGDYSVCVLPITGSLQDPTFMQRLQENAASVKVYCKKVKLQAAPNDQTVTVDVPAMTPLPAP